VTFSTATKVVDTSCLLPLERCIRAEIAYLRGVILRFQKAHCLSSYILIPGFAPGIRPDQLLPIWIRVLLKNKLSSGFHEIKVSHEDIV
jgi:hypothetical protein